MLSPAPTQKQLLQKYVDAVLSAPTSLGLTATEDPAEFWERHVLDALKILSLLPSSVQEQKIKAIDIGSGNGIPGIPIAIALPQWEIFLLDSSNKKCGFLDLFCKSNAIKNVHVLPGRSEELAYQANLRSGFDFGFARALGKLPTALELSAPFIKRDGTLVIPHGQSYTTEIQSAKKAMKELGVEHQSSVPYKLNGSITYTALFFIKTIESPGKYPRKSGIPSKRPL